MTYFRSSSTARVLLAWMTILLIQACAAGVAAGEADIVLQRFYEDSRETLAACIQVVFGEDAARIPPALLALETRPALNFQRDRERLSSLRRRHHGGQSIDGLTVPPPLGGHHGTIIVVREYHPRLSEEGFLRTYVHELGNLLDYALHPDLGDTRLMRHYGKPDCPSGDDDTGQSLESCMHFRGAFVQRPWLVVRVETAAAGEWP